MGSVSHQLSESLQNADSNVYDLIKKEELRQKECITLIASENFASKAIQEAVGSVLSNKYSEGYPGQRYYAGNHWIDQIELLCCERALQLYGLDPAEWGVIPQALSGSPANLAVYTAFLDPGAKILALDLPDGGHLSHGYQTDSKKVSAVSKFFTTQAYHVDHQTGVIDYAEMASLATTFQPECIVAGASAYALQIDYQKFRNAADACQAFLLIDMAHTAGLIAAKLMPSPFDYADVVTTTTHKTLRGPRGALIYYRKKPFWTKAKYQQNDDLFEKDLKAAVFPGLQGGPHDHTIAGIAVALGLALRPDFEAYQRQVLDNMKALCSALKSKGFAIVADTTENHMVLVDLRSKGLSGAKMEKLCEVVNLIINKNSVPGDRSAMNPSGIRLGTPAMTTRGMTKAQFVRVADLLDDLVHVGVELQKKSGPKLKDFVELLYKEPPEELSKIKQEIVEMALGLEYYAGLS